MSYDFPEITEELERDLLADITSNSYYEFFKAFWPTIIPEPFIDNWHIKFLCDEVQIVGEWIINNQPAEYDLIINIPPGQSKSTIATRLFPAWLWTRKASTKIISGSHSQNLAIKHASDSRDCVKSELYQHLFGNTVQLRRDTDGKTFYKNTSGGWRYPVSTGSSVMGEHGHLILIDDALDREQAESQVQRKTAVDWVNKTLPTRKVDLLKTPTILIMQRLHEGDPTGEWLKQSEEGGKKIRHICLPGTDEYNISPRDTVVEWNGMTKTVAEWYDYNGGVLNQDRLSKEALKKLKSELGSRAFAGQVGQSPKPIEGTIFKKHYFQTLKPNEIPLGVLKQPRHFVVDTAETKNQKNDPYGILHFKFFNNVLYIYRFDEKWMEFPEAVKFLEDTLKEHGSQQKSKMVIEPKSSGKSVVQYLTQHTLFNVVEYSMLDGDKEARAATVAAKIEPGNRVVVVDDGTWDVPGFIDKLLMFPAAAHDEAVDNLVMAAHLTLMPEVGSSKKRRNVRFFS